MRFARRHRSAAVIGGCLAILVVVSACSSSHKASGPTTTTPSIGGTTPTTATPPSTGSTVPPPSGPQASTTNTNVALGAFVKYAGSDYSPIATFDQQLGRAPAIIQGFYGWEDAKGKDILFPTSFVDYVAAQGAVPMITWQPSQAGISNGATNASTTTTQPSFTLTALASGTHDAYIRQWAEAAKSYGRPLYVRMMHEMNLGGYPWALGVNGNTSAAQFVTAWRHIVGIFQQVGANNVQFVWCVGAGSKTQNAEDAALYPGDAWVQWVAIDGYNRNVRGWEMISNIFGPPYTAITAFSHRPVMIAETASVEEAGQPMAKAQWITTGFLTQIPQLFPRVKAVLYFDSSGNGFTFPPNSSTQAFSAFKAVASNPMYKATAPTQPLNY